MAEKGDTPNKTQLDQKLDRAATQAVPPREKYDRKGDKGQLIADTLARPSETDPTQMASWSMNEIERVLNNSVLKSSRTNLDVFGRTQNQKSDMRLRTLSTHLESRMASQFKDQLVTGAKAAKLTPFDLKSQSLRMIATNASLGAYQFQKTQHLPYMRKNLALGYKSVSLLKSISTGITSLEKALVAKLEAIKINTAASAPRKQSYFQKLWGDVGFLNRRRVAGNISNFVMDGYDRTYKKFALPTFNGIHDAMTDSSQGGGVNAVRRKATGKLNAVRRTARAVEQTTDASTKMGKLRQLGARSVAGVASGLMRGAQRVKFAEQTSHKIGDLLKPVTGVTTRFNPFSSNGYGDTNWDPTQPMGATPSAKQAANDTLLASFNNWREEYRQNSKESLAYLEMMAHGGRGPIKPGRRTGRKLPKVLDPIHPTPGPDDADIRGYTPAEVTAARAAGDLALGGQSPQQLRGKLKGGRIYGPNQPLSQRIKSKLDISGRFTSMVAAVEKAVEEAESKAKPIRQGRTRPIDPTTPRRTMRTPGAAPRPRTTGRTRRYTSDTTDAVHILHPEDTVYQAARPTGRPTVVPRIDQVIDQQTRPYTQPTKRFSFFRRAKAADTVLDGAATASAPRSPIDLGALQKKLDATRANSGIDKAFLEKMVGRIGKQLGGVTEAVQDGSQKRSVFEKLQVQWKNLQESKEARKARKNSYEDLHAQDDKRKGLKEKWTGFKSKTGHLIRGVTGSLGQGNLVGAAASAGGDMVSDATDWAKEQAQEKLEGLWEEKSSNLKRRGKIGLKRGMRKLKGRFGRRAAGAAVEAAETAVEGVGRSGRRVGARNAGRLAARAARASGRGLIGGISGGMGALTRGAEAGIPMVAQGAVKGVGLAGKGAWLGVKKGIPLAASGVWGATKLAGKATKFAVPLAAKGAWGASKLTGKLGWGITKGLGKGAGVLGKGVGGLAMKGVGALGKGGLAGITVGLGAGMAHDWFDKNTTGATARTGKTAATAASWGATGAMLGSIVPGLGTLAGGAIGAGLGALYENLDVITSGLKTAGSFVYRGVATAGNAVASAGSAVWGALVGKDAVLKDGKVISKQRFSINDSIRAGLFGRDAQYTKDGQLISSGVDGLTNKIQRGMYGLIFGDPNFSLLDAAAAKGKSMMEVLSKNLNGAYNAATGAVGNAAQAAGNAISGAATSVGNYGTGLVNDAMSMLGMGEKSDNAKVKSYLAQGGALTAIDPSVTAWCAAFVNATLAKNGMKGSGSLAASSFLSWGTKVDPTQVQAGDVLVEDRGVAIGKSGAHVGIATGATRKGSNGQLQIEMISGNSSNKVTKTWYSAGKLKIRRSKESPSSGSSGGLPNGQTATKNDWSQTMKANPGAAQSIMGGGGQGAKGAGGSGAGPRATGADNGAMASMLNKILDYEGGSKLVTDAGGLTKYGISAKSNPGVDIRNLTEQQAREIYIRKYAAGLGLERLSPAAALVVLDASINQGPAFAKRLVAQGGGNPARMLAMRQQRYDELVAKDPQKHAKNAGGWKNRLAKLASDIGLSGDAVRLAANDNKAPKQPTATKTSPAAVIAKPNVEGSYKDYQASKSVAPVRTASSPTSVTAPIRVTPQAVMSGTAKPMTTQPAIAQATKPAAPVPPVMSNSSKELEALMKTMVAQTEATRQNTQALLGHGAKLDSIQPTPASTPVQQGPQTAIIPLFQKSKTPSSTGTSMSMRKTSVFGG